MGQHRTRRQQALIRRCCRHLATEPESYFNNFICGRFVWRLYRGPIGCRRKQVFSVLRRVTWSVVAVVKQAGARMASRPAHNSISTLTGFRVSRRCLPSVSQSVDGALWTKIVSPMLLSRQFERRLQRATVRRSLVGFL